MPEATQHKRLLGFDFGLKQIGVASGQTLTSSATGLTILKAVDGIPKWDQVEKLLKEWSPDLVVVGLPLNMDDSESDLSNRARKFARRLQGRFAVEVEMVDERLTSREAKSIGRDQGTQDLTKIDHIAASLILQSWLDAPSIGTAP
ncbi:Holliday junction resolvase RuvX [Porticoccaceae bacterium]|nr:Holliday junction resolvase RuvX [Porticoccaceae bacterium]MDC0089492.1 Holliday junction resolvase RuvX [Porticoccaceae bacterium]